MNTKKYTWISYDMGNSAHALIITTICFPLFFKEYLFADNSDVNSLWSMTTAIILAVSALLSPMITAYAYSKQKRSSVFLITSLLCIIPTFFLGIFDTCKYLIVGLYLLSCVGYYISLPLYNSYLPNLGTTDIQKTSSDGWGWGYCGGIIVAVVCLLLGLLNYKPNEIIFKYNFLIAAIFLVVFCLPFLVNSFRIEKSIQKKENQSRRISLFSVWSSIVHHKNIVHLLLVYWFVGEVATIGIYFFAIYMSEYTNLDAKWILILSLAIQFIGFFSTILSGRIAKKFGAKRTIFAIITIWVFVPFLLFGVSKGLSYWIPVVVIGLIVGSYHSIIRAEIAKKVQSIENLGEKGSVWGFFDMTGRFSQILSPIFITLVLQFASLNYAILCTTIFPVIAFIFLRKYNE
ncbi:MAG: MFS transporter [Prevotellaceae bacterium]|jgi:UMF1 family MFS transporter|nr:MFS transporter [Prevotellaceae bacterium]